MRQNAATARPATRQATRPPSPRAAARWPIVAGLVVAALAAALVAYAVRSSAPDSHPTADGFGHVHGMAVDDTGALFVATHVGLYRVQDRNTAVRVSAETPDLMGFTTDGPGRFLASGHPGAHGDGPANLGLIESTDGGVTWRNTSLAGAADFHGLQAAHGAVYGYNSTDGVFMVSTGRETWDRRSAGAMGAFAVSPTDADTVLAVTRAGLQRSTDGGRTWQPVPGGGGFAAMSWTTAGLWGIGPDGAVRQSADGGTTWQQRGTVPGEPHAVTAGAGALYVAVTGDTIFASRDSGVTWVPHYSPR
ncbi:F510_1955 family glycosylhydrolase [Actinoplanes sp. NPDC049802]|uniref:F510_1955 family glycosylhydrolase n=1 Tax=Actinoplanes sp. NPDC049802 TaxID=3154742 RepID=UPI0033DDB71C